MLAGYPTEGKGNWCRGAARALENIQRPLAALEKLKIFDIATYAKAKMDLRNIGVVEAVNDCSWACVRSLVLWGGQRFGFHNYGCEVCSKGGYSCRLCAD